MLELKCRNSYSDSAEFVICHMAWNLLLLFYQFPLEVTFVTVVATGLLVSLSPSNPRTRSTATPHEAIFMFPSMGWYIL